MNIFLSWSGSRSKALAGAFREWLPKVLQTTKPWMSANDINSGERWASNINEKLQDTKFGILFVTPDNMTAPWLLFEAGALSKVVDESFVCPLLQGLRISDLDGPLAMFQASQLTKEGTKSIIVAINSALGSNAIPEPSLSETFEVWWPKLEEKIKTAAEIELNASEIVTKRSQDEKLDELIERSRQNAKRESNLSKQLENFQNSIERVSQSFESTFSIETIGELMSRNGNSASNDAKEGMIEKVQPLLNVQGDLVKMMRALGDLVKQGLVDEELPVKILKTSKLRANKENPGP